MRAHGFHHGGVLQIVEARVKRLGKPQGHRSFERIFCGI
ncbi:unnamed protein product [Chondrus crispus]|uniref:Uncharacterized protein n=1 Tax=Chondrus crispus TaxID=2769 RepID=R7Q4K5_CHOCR|nr:unnamed protein product [Chondrus crispus]CDF33452.1 unnamed protein product [Chondrus crispus]|eukprot:XP_005713255.1 unnamed protein product [Chondrus crispus]